MSKLSKPQINKANIVFYPDKEIGEDSNKIDINENEK